MKSSIQVIILFLASTFTVIAQQPLITPAIDTFSIEYLNKYKTNFNITAKGFEGEGADVLIKAIQKAQFTVLGEYHGSAMLSQFTEAILQPMQSAGYNKFALEVGPHTAGILQQISSIPSETVKKLHDFNSHYYIPMEEEDDSDTSIPFFDGVEDAKFLARASELGFELWGLDQEYYAGLSMLADQLLELAAGKTSLTKIRADKIAFDSLFLDSFKKSTQEGQFFKIFPTLTEHEVTKTFFGHFSKTDTQAQAIIAALYKTWDIYGRSGKRGGYSHGHRVSYIRENFSKKYQASKEAQPKVFIKFGAYHAGKSYAGSVYDIGNLSNDLAQANGQQAIHIQSLGRYYTEDGELHDEYDPQSLSARRHFYVLGEKDRWSVLDLRPIRKHLLNFQLQVMTDVDFHLLKYYTENFDFILLPPTDRETVKNYNAMK